MTNRTSARPTLRDSALSRTALMDRTFRSASLVAGGGLLLMAALAGFGIFVAVEGLVTPGDAAATARDVMASEGLFRLGIASLVGVVVLDVLVAWALQHVFAHVDQGLSRLAAWLRIVYAGVFLVAITDLLGAVRLLGDADALAVIGADQLQAQALLQIASFTDVWDAGLVLFGLHLLVVGFLACRSRLVPTVLGVLVVLAGVGYTVDSLTAVLGLSTNLGAVTFFGEVLLAFWLVIRGRHLVLGSARDDLMEVSS